MRARYPVSPRAVNKGSRAFRTHESRDAMYKVATFLVDHFWGKPREMADALGVLLLTWNNALYRYGSFDFSALEKTLRKSMALLNGFRKRDIKSYSKNDRTVVEELFNAFLDALKIADGKSKGRRSPVAVSKALHLLAPSFFPLWDDKIAKDYKCNYSTNPSAKYLTFIRIVKNMAEDLDGKIQTHGATVLKIIDEYNYAKFTKQWT